MKYHRGQDGKSRICNAKIKCRLGTETTHFATKEECDNYCDKINEVLSLTDKSTKNIIEELTDDFGCHIYPEENEWTRFILKDKEGLEKVIETQIEDAIREGNEELTKNPEEFVNKLVMKNLYNTDLFYGANEPLPRELATKYAQADFENKKFYIDEFRNKEDKYDKKIKKTIDKIFQNAVEGISQKDMTKADLEEFTNRYILSTRDATRFADTRLLGNSIYGNQIEATQIRINSYLQINNKKLKDAFSSDNKQIKNIYTQDFPTKQEIEELVRVDESYLGDNYTEKMRKFDKICDEQYSNLLSKLNMEYLPTQEPVFIRQNKGLDREADTIAVIRNLDVNTEMNYVTVAYGKMDKSGKWRNDTDCNSTNCVHFSVPFWKDDKYLTTYGAMQDRIKNDFVNKTITKEELIGVLPERELERISKGFGDKRPLKVILNDASEDVIAIKQGIAESKNSGVIVYIGDCVILPVD